MSAHEQNPGDSYVIDIKALDLMMSALADQDHDVIGPVRRDGAVVYEPISATSDLPRGWIDEQAGGHYRLKREGEAYFGFTVGPGSWKRFLHPPKQELWHGETKDGEATIHPAPIAGEKYAFFGVRSCELAAIAVQDKVFLEGPYVDPHYAARRAALFIIALNCGRAADTCFCTSMQTGPKARAGFDIALTETATGENAAFLAVAGSDAGEALLANLPVRVATPQDIAAADKATTTAKSQITRRMDTTGLPAFLKENRDHPRWDEVAARCLNCANCTMVCPTCFCTDVEEVSDLEGIKTARVQTWASCFTSDFSYLHGGGPVRAEPVARYRQWMTHKLSTWFDQFDMSGCVGCGRCISWCPVGIDITEEVAAMRGEKEGG